MKGVAEVMLNMPFSWLLAGVLRIVVQVLLWREAVEQMRGEGGFRQGEWKVWEWKVWEWTCIQHCTHVTFDL